MARGTAAILLLLASGGAARAQDGSPDPIITDRPDQTESAVSVPRGYVQIESGWSMMHAGNGGVAVRGHAVAETLLRLGLTRGWEARIGFGGWQRSVASGTPAATGVGDLELGFKYQLSPEGTGPLVALMSDVALPTGSDGFSGEQVSPVLRLSVSHDLSQSVSTGYNVGLSASRAGGGAAATTALDALYTWTVGFALAERVSGFAEVFGTVGINDAGSSSALLDGGVAVQLRPNLQLDLAGGFGITGAAEDWFLGAGISVRLPR